MLNLPEVRIPAIRAIRSMGVQAISAMPKVCELLQNTDLFIRAHALLAEAMGIKTIEGPIRGLKDPFPMNTYLAAVWADKEKQPFKLYPHCVKTSNLRYTEFVKVQTKPFSKSKDKSKYTSRIS